MQTLDKDGLVSISSSSISRQAVGIMATFKLHNETFKLTAEELARVPGSVLAEAAACERKADDPIHVKGWKAADCAVFKVSCRP